MRSLFPTSRRRFLQSTAAIVALGARLPFPAFAAEGDLIVRTPDPYNAEPPLAQLVASRITPVKHFYVRNHGEMPKIDAANLKIRIEGLVERPVEYSLDELKQRFSQASAEATLTCGGNRRQELSQIKEVSGVQWDAGAIGHAQWTGVKLADVLKAAGIKTGAKHVWFDGHDDIREKDGTVAPFGGSIPLEKALATDSPALLAHAMNGQPLTPEHGSPLRTIVPGYIGARSVKWLSKITVSDRPSPNHYVAEAYKIVKTEDKGELAAADPIYANVVNAAICQPAAGAMLKAGKTTVSGYALPSGQRRATIERVEVSADGGQSWTRARLSGEASPYSWQLWTADLDLRPGKQELIARAIDSTGNATPERGQWNLKGYLYNAWHRVSVDVA
jgi:sulfite oxidase